jgi:hypothetical protein
METQPLSRISSSDHSVSIWVILAGILLLSGLVAIGALTLLDATSKAQLQTGTQSTTPAR